MGIPWLFGTRESRYRPGRSVLSTRRDLEVYSYLAYEPMFHRGWCVAGEVQSFQYKVMNAKIIYHVRSRPSHESSRVFSVECFARSSQSEVAGAAIFGSYFFLMTNFPILNQELAMNSLLESNPWRVSVPLSMLTFYEDIYISELRDSLSKADQYFFMYWYCIVTLNVVMHCIIPACIIFWYILYYDICIG